MIYDTLKQPPAPGSPLEAVMVYVFNARQRAEYLRTLLTLRTVKTEEQSKAVKELLESYTAELFPFEEKNKWLQSEEIEKVLQREMEKGPLAVVPQKSMNSDKS